MAVYSGRRRLAEVKEKKTKSCKEALGIFAEKTSIHGLGYVFGRKENFSVAGYSSHV